MNKTMIGLMFFMSCLSTLSYANCEYQNKNYEPFENVSVLDSAWYLLNDVSYSKNGYMNIYTCSPLVDLTDESLNRGIMTIHAVGTAWVPTDFSVGSTTEVVFAH